MTDQDVRTEIMIATYEALCERGYSDLTAQDIADRTGKSKSLLFYHYESTDALMVDFVDFLLEQFDERVEATREQPAVERLATFVDWFLYGVDDDEQTAFHTALLELRAQAPYNDRFREQLRRSDERLRATLEEILREGVESGTFTAHDPGGTAALLIAAFDGARVRQLTTTNDEYLEAVRTAATEWVIDELLVDGHVFPDRQATPSDPIKQ